MFGRDLVFRRPVDFWSRKVHGKSASHHFSSKSFRKPPEGPWRPPEASGRSLDDFSRMGADARKNRKSSQRVLRTTRRWRSIDRPKFSARKVNRPAKNKISAVQRLIVAPSVKWSLHRGSNDVLNWFREIPEVRNRAVSFLTKSQIKLFTFLPRP